MIRISRVKLLLNDAEAHLIVKADVETSIDDRGLHVSVNVITAELEGKTMDGESLPESLIKLLGNAIADQVFKEYTAQGERQYVN